MAYLFLTLYSKTPATTSHFDSQKTSKVESLFFSKNWQLYFSVAYLFLTLYSKTPATTSHFDSQKTSKVESLFFSKNWQLYFSRVYLFWTPPPMLFLQLPPVHSPSTARPPDHPLQSRSSISSLLPCYFCTSSPSTARPPPVHRPSTGSWPSISLLYL